MFSIFQPFLQLGPPEPLLIYVTLLLKLSSILVIFFFFFFSLASSPKHLQDHRFNVLIMILVHMKVSTSRIKMLNVLSPHTTSNHPVCLQLGAHVWVSGSL